MSQPEEDWNPKGSDVLDHQIHAYDKMRTKCPVAYSKFLHWSLFRHADIMRVLLNHRTFSNNVSDRVSVPNSMDPPEHTLYRAIIEEYFTPERMADFEPPCRQIAHKLTIQLERSRPVEFISAFAMKYALAVQCAFLGWPEDLQQRLAQWMKKNHAATLSQNPSDLKGVAREFSDMVSEILTIRRTSPAQPASDVISGLQRNKVNGRPLTEEEIVSILRNWTGGEVGTISAAVGIIAHFLAESPSLQTELRTNPTRIPEAIDEILRLHGPLVLNRRKTMCPVEIGDRSIPAGERLSLFWVSANRDERVFENPEEFRWGRDHSKNLLYGAGIHVCPGAPLAKLELRVIIEELLANTTALALHDDSPIPRAVYPASGFAQAHLVVS